MCLPGDICLNGKRLGPSFPGTVGAGGITFGGSGLGNLDDDGEDDDQGDIVVRATRLKKRITVGRSSPQNVNPVCPNPKSVLGGTRSGAGAASNLLGNAANAAAVAGLIPSVASLPLEGAATALKVGSAGFTAIQLGASALYGLRTGNFTAFRSDLASAIVGFVPFGKGASALRSFDNPALSAAARKGTERVVDAAMGANNTANLPSSCP